MSEKFISKFVNSEIMTKGGDATPLNKKIDEHVAYLKKQISDLTIDTLYGPFTGSQTFTANGTFTPVTDIVWVTGIASGGNGGAAFTSSTISNGGGGGGAGQWAFRYPIKVVKGTPITVTVGTGNTVFGSYLTLSKGTTGSNSTSTSGGTGGAAKTGYIGRTAIALYSTYGSGGGGAHNTGTSLIADGGAGESARQVLDIIDRTVTYAGGSGGTKALGGGGGGAPGILRIAGITPGNGGGSSSNGTGSAGGSYGAGGGGGGQSYNSSSSAGYAGGAGGAGILKIEWLV